MMTRREFLGAAAAGAGLLARIPDILAGKYELLIKGGRVIDPAGGIDAVRDVALAAGRIAAVEPGIAADSAAEVLDASGKLVVPGLVDIHTHAARAKDTPAVCLTDGVTCFVDAGSVGADRIDDVVANARTAPNRGRVLINLARTGVQSDGELMDLSRADVAAARAAIARHRDMIVGVKARLSFNVAGAGDLEALKRAQEVAGDLPVMIHMGQTVSPMPRILALLKRGDIVTHMYAPEPNSILDDNGRVLPEVVAARKRGIWFDIGNGRNGHLWWNVAERALKQGFPPDTISTDWTTEGRVSGVIDFPNCLSKFLMLGMPLDRVIACGTINAARTFEAFGDRGTLKVGAPGDVAILDLREGGFEFVDNYRNVRSGRQRLFPSATVLAGKRVPPRAA
ncbi:MAG TPA: amidohydrolase/deacetylase family metallohydrolase [Burkholderiales bacterium]|nr:amidohydrolase/deacetylase family metallohydrolase [Burkholderiales bacterium]